MLVNNYKVAWRHQNDPNRGAKPTQKLSGPSKVTLVSNEPDRTFCAIFPNSVSSEQFDEIIAGKDTPELISRGTVTFEGKQHFSRPIGRKESLSAALKAFKREDRQPFWDAYFENFPKQGPATFNVTFDPAG